MNQDLSKNYSEINEILDLLGDSFKTKIPSKLKNMFIEKADKTYSPGLTINDFYAGKYMEETKIILSILFINYWSDANEKQEYMDKLKKLDEEYNEKHKLVLNEIFPKIEAKPVEPNEEEKQITNTEKTGFMKIIMDLLDKNKDIIKK